ncbi:MAG: sigma-70 family RNA polymerase sigma factor [Clostridia bacterium]|nr:sigma-70 family RNA polymerase sigma factor [Clostridia bacterium]
MKQRFEDIVEENSAWIYRTIRSKVGDRSTAEDLVQEVWLRVFRAYDSYTEDGRLRHWLMRITRNVINSFYAQSAVVSVMSLDADEGDDDPLVMLLADGSSPDPEDMILRKELTEEVLAAVAKLPEKPRQILIFRFIHDMTVGEVAKRMNIPEGSVKSGAHYGIEKLRRELGINTNKGEKIMDCKACDKYLFMYAIGKLDGSVKAEVERHLEECGECAYIAEALRQLIPQIYTEDGEYRHYCINIPERNTDYVALGIPFGEEQAAINNAHLSELGGVIPEDELWFATGIGPATDVLGIFLNEGEEIGFREYFDGRYKKSRATRVEKVYPWTWMYKEMRTNSPAVVGHVEHTFGSPIHTGYYQLVPRDAKKVIIRRGSGVIRCGDAKFACSDRYAAQDEMNVLEYGWLR